MNLIVSTTARQTGYGSDPRKLVAGLTRDEKLAAASGERVVFVADRPSSRGKDGTRWRVVYSPATRLRSYYPRVPTPAEVAYLIATTGKN
jgi:hypothetical protein